MKNSLLLIIIKLFFIIRTDDNNAKLNNTNVTNVETGVINKDNKEHYIDEYSIISKFEIEQNESKTFYFNIIEKTVDCKFNLQLFISDNSNVEYSENKLSIEVISPSNKNIYKNEIDKENSKVNELFEFKEIGDYSIIFSNPENNVKIIDLEIGLVHCHYIPKKMDKNDVNLMNEKFSKQVTLINNLIEEGNYYESNEILSFERQDKVFENMITSTIFEIVVVLVLSVWQVYILKNILSNKQLI